MPDSIPSLSLLEEVKVADSLVDLSYRDINKFSHFNKETSPAADRFSDELLQKESLPTAAPELLIEKTPQIKDKKKADFRFLAV